MPLRAVESGHAPFDRPVGRSKVVMYLSTGLETYTQTLDPLLGGRKLVLDYRPARWTVERPGRPFDRPEPQVAVFVVFVLFASSIRFIGFIGIS